MVHQEGRPPTDFSAKPTKLDSAIIPAGADSNRTSAPVSALGNSSKPQSSFFRKADAVLKGELESRPSLGTQVLPGDVLPNSKDLETTVEAFRQELSGIQIF